MSDCVHLLELIRSDKVTYLYQNFGKLKMLIFYFIGFLFKIIFHGRKVSLNNGTDNASQVIRLSDITFHSFLFCPFI